MKDAFASAKANYLNNIGMNYREIGENKTALKFLYRALLLWEILEQNQLKQKSPSSDNFISNKIQNSPFLQSVIQTVKANSFTEIGTTLFNLGKKLEAINSYQKALKIFQNQNVKTEQALTLVEIGKVQRSLGEYQQAIDSYNQAVVIWRELKAVVDEANTHLEIAKAERDRNNLTEARTQIETAIQLIETQPPPLDAPAQTASSSEQKQFQAYISLTSYFSAKQYFYDFYVDLLMQQHKQNPNKGYLVEALQVSEQSRGRSLLAILNRRDRYVSTNKNKVDNQKAQNIARVPEIAKIQRQILDDDSVLLEYLLGEERS